MLANVGLLCNAVGPTRPALFRGKGVKDTSRSASYVLLSVVALMMVMLAMGVALLSPSGVRSLVVNLETFGFPKELLQRVRASMASVLRMASSA
jgi:sulfite exporter TauE/SafE